MTPTQRTLKAQKELGRHCWIVEKWNRFAGRPGGVGIRQDMFGIIDIVALDYELGVVGVQSTGQDFAGHLKKLMVEKRAETLRWLSTPGTHLELWGWRKVKKFRGSKQEVWRPRTKILTLADFGDPLA